MTLQPTLAHCPASGALKESCGLPLGWLATPFARVAGKGRDDQQQQPLAGDIARCRQCYAYINHICAFQTHLWTCSLCGAANDLTSLASRRYASPAARRVCPELQPGLVEASCPLPTSEDVGGVSAAYEVHVRPAYVLLLDATGGPAFVDLVSGALLAAMEGMAECSLIGLATFDAEIALYDLRGTTPSVRRIPLVDEGDKPTPLDLQDVVLMEDFLSPLADCREAVLAAVEGLQALQSKAEQGQGEHSRGFGPALQAMLRFIGSAGSSLEHALAEDSSPDVRPSLQHGVQVLAFLAGPPNRGRGSVMGTIQDSAPPARPAEWAPVSSSLMYDATNVEASFFLPSHEAVEENGAAANGSSYPDADAQGLRPSAKAVAFYEQAAEAAGALNTCVNVWAGCDEWCGLEAMLPLSRGCGGCIGAYPCTAASALPQDVFRRVVSATATQGELRIRTSPGLHPTRFYGPLVPDASYDSLAHLGCIQQRLLRILTMPIEVASSPQDVIEHADPDAIATLLMHKIVLVAQNEGRLGAAGLLRDWLSRLVASFHTLYRRNLKGLLPEQVDVSFEAVEALQPLPRLIYGLLYSPLLLGSPSSVSRQSDVAAAMQALWCALPASEAACAAYSVLSSFSDPDTLAFPRHSLSSTAIETAGAPIFLLDAYTSIFILYTLGAPSSMPFPPGPSSAVRKAAAAMRIGRRVMPSLLMLQEGQGDQAFRARLIEDPTQGNAGFVAFLDALADQAWQILQAH
ncbi:hypothetical protein WJX73_000348 [Symbiochloris irregularis]|uniref:Zinc finger Sec23/Sec24-type domain-containing protein n=1 Tax=Symbiochloris irregularis TaxID=706552 RepID=A0AAW1NUG9_9CHLO